MKKTIISICSNLLILSMYAQVNPKVSIPASQPIDNRNLEYIRTIDPAVTAIDFKLVKQRTGDRLKITGTVKNKGGRAYTSGANQQEIQMWEIYSSEKRSMVSHKPFGNLNPGEVIRIVYDRPAFKVSNEFPPDYEVIIVYDPDIHSDNNTANDDANLNNNSMRKNPNSR